MCIRRCTPTRSASFRVASVQPVYRSNRTGTHDCAIRSTTPVSYTHLDVYKRQVKCQPDLVMKFCGPIIFVSNYMCDTTDNALKQRFFDIHAGHGYWSVSYTHLDVYKRQGL